MPILVRLLFFLTVLLSSCTERETHRLTPQPANTTGIDFVNRLDENDTTNILVNEYLYNGGGIGVGDFDGNGLPDLFFGGNLVSSRLYLQREPWRFEDVTEAAGLITDIWIAGVNVHDVDGNGYEDLYLATLNPNGEMDTPNLLFLNQGPGEGEVPVFSEAAAEYGLDNKSYGTHSAWFDLENDGDLDLYVLNNSIEPMGRKLLRGTDTTGTARSIDYIYENTDSGPNGSPTFTQTDLITTEGWGLGIVPQDFNGDGYTDLYVANDFISDDQLLINDGLGNLRPRTKQALVHTSKNSMGVDAGDLNNDGFPDVMTVDMLPDDNLRMKTMFSDISFQQDATANARGYSRQYVRNALQINNRDSTFSDVAFLTGTAATDWSWTPLLADFDNNGFRDIFISNGYPRDVTNRDFVDFAQSTAMFGTNEAILQNTLAALYEIDGVFQPNYIFANEGALDFSLSDWLPPTPTYSNGAVYVDLDLDGDLDLITNNLNEPAGVYRNFTRERYPDSSNYLQITLEGPAGNPDALGTKVYLTYGERQGYAEQQRQRGYLSTVDATLHFGLGGAEMVDSLLIVWPDGRVTERTNLNVNRRIQLSYANSTALARRRPKWTRRPKVALVPIANGPAHVESSHSDFDNAPLAVRDRSHDGPALATADIDGDGRDELVMGGAAGQPARVYRRNGTELTEIQALPETEALEVSALLPLDYDGDGDLDLYVGTGSSEFSYQPENYRDLLFENVDGRFEYAGDALPDLLRITATVAMADLEGDGDPDIFVGVRNQINAYPRAEESYVLVNEEGRFRPGPTLEAGLVTDAVWTDLNGDGTPDLVTVGEYSPPRTFLNRGGKFEPQEVGDALAGWWYSLAAADADGDGDMDLLAGNVGLNTFYRATADRPLRLRVDDYDNNDRLDPILMMYIGDRSHPVHPRNTLGRQVPGFKKLATTYEMYGGWSEEVMPELSPEGFILEAREMRSVYLENDGAGNFSPHFLPNAGQTAPIRDAVFIETGGRRGWLAAQNDHAVEVLGGRLDAGTGLFVYVEEGAPRVDSDYWSVRDDARSVARLDSLVVVGVNDGPLRFYGPLTR